MSNDVLIVGEAVPSGPAGPRRGPGRPKGAKTRGGRRVPLERTSISVACTWEWRAFVDEVAGRRRVRYGPGGKYRRKATAPELFEHLLRKYCKEKGMKAGDVPVRLRDDDLPAGVLMP